MTTALIYFRKGRIWINLVCNLTLMYWYLGGSDKIYLFYSTFNLFLWYLYWFEKWTQIASLKQASSFIINANEYKLAHLSGSIRIRINAPKGENGWQQDFLLRIFKGVFLQNQNDFFEQSAVGSLLNIKICVCVK